MLHVTSWMQNVTKISNFKEIKSIDYVRDEKRQHTYIYDHYLNKYNYQYHYDIEDFNSIGYWGCVRDKNADRTIKPKNSIVSRHSVASHDGYWGQFEDDHLTPFQSNQSTSASIPSIGDNMSTRESSELKIEPTTIDLQNDSVDFKRPNRSYLYDYKSSNIKIQAFKRDETKYFYERLNELESSYSKELVKSFDLNPTSRVGSLTSDDEQLPIIALSPKSNELEWTSSNRSQINLIFFSNSSASKQSSSSSSCNSENDHLNYTRLLAIKNHIDVLTKLNKTINIFAGDLNLSENPKCKRIVSLLNINAYMRGLDDLFTQLTRNLDDESAKLVNINQARSIKNTVHLCSNIVQTSMTDMMTLGSDNHSTMIFESNGTKIGFMALVDEAMFRRLDARLAELNIAKKHRQIEYTDYLIEANKSAKHMRQCGAKLIVALTYMEDEENRCRLANEANDLNLIFNTRSRSTANDNESAELIFDKLLIDKATDSRYQKPYYRWLITNTTSSHSIDRLSLVSMRVKKSSTYYIDDISITKYNLV